MAEPKRITSGEMLFGWDSGDSAKFDEEQGRFRQNVDEEGAIWGTAEYLSELPDYGRILDPLGFGADSSDNVQLREVSEQLSPDVRARAQQSVDAARSLRGRPLVSGMRARMAGQQGLQQQAGAMAGGTPESRLAMRGQGAGMGAKILGQYGGQMAGESVERFSLGTKMAQAASQLEQGQVIFGLGEKLRNYLTKKGVNLNEQQARNMALSTAVTFAQSQKKAPSSSGGGVKAEVESGDSGAFDHV